MTMLRSASAKVVMWSTTKAAEDRFGVENYHLSYHITPKEAQTSLEASLLGVKE